MDIIARLLQFRFAQRTLLWTVAKRRHDTETLDAYMRPLILDVGVRRDLTSFLKNVSKRYTLEASQSFQDFYKPVLSVWGADDFIFSLRFAERLRNDFPDAKLEIVPNSRAFIPEDQPRLLAQYLEDFVPQRIGIGE